MVRKIAAQAGLVEEYSALRSAMMLTQVRGVRQGRLVVVNVPDEFRRERSEQLVGSIDDGNRGPVRG